MVHRNRPLARETEPRAAGALGQDWSSKGLVYPDPLMAPNEYARCGGGSEAHDLFESRDGQAAAFVVGNINNVIGLQSDVGRLAIHDLLERHGDFVLAAGLPFPAIDVRIARRELGEPFSHCEQLHQRPPRKALQPKCTSLFTLSP